MHLNIPASGPNLAATEDAVHEAIRDNPRGVDWFGIACAITDAHARDVLAQEPER